MSHVDQIISIEVSNLGLILIMLGTGLNDLGTRVVYWSMAIEESGMGTKVLSPASTQVWPQWIRAWNDDLGVRVRQQTTGNRVPSMAFWD